MVEREGKGRHLKLVKKIHYKREKEPEREKKIKRDLEEDKKRKHDPKRWKQNMHNKAHSLKTLKCYLKGI